MLVLNNPSILLYLPLSDFLRYASCPWFYASLDSTRNAQLVSPQPVTRNANPASHPTKSFNPKFHISNPKSKGQLLHHPANTRNDLVKRGTAGKDTLNPHFV